MPIANKDMTADRDAHVALLHDHWAQNLPPRTDSFQSDGSTSDQAGTLSAFLEGASQNNSNCSSQTITMPVDQFERLLRTCADALEKSRSNTHIPLQESRPFPGSKEAADLGEKPQYPQAANGQRRNVTGNLQHRNDADTPQVPDMEHYDFKEPSTLILEDEDDWNLAKLNAKSILDGVEDVWEEHFPDCNHEAADAAHTKCHPLNDRNIRIECQR